MKTMYLRQILVKGEVREKERSQNASNGSTRLTTCSQRKTEKFLIDEFCLDKVMCFNIDVQCVCIHYVCNNNKRHSEIYDSHVTMCQ